MKKFVFKKQAIVLTLVAALGLAVYLNYHFTNNGITNNAEDGKTLGEALFVSDGDTAGEQEKDDTVSVDTKVDYFAQARKNREAAREEAIDIIKDIAADMQTNSEAADKVMEKVTALTAAVEKEVKLEGLIKAKGFADCVVYLSDDTCSVVVKGKDLTAAQTLQITEIVTAGTGVSAQKLNIMAVNS